MISNVVFKYKEGSLSFQMRPIKDIIWHNFVIAFLENHSIERYVLSPEGKHIRHAVVLNIALTC